MERSRFGLVAAAVGMVAVVAGLSIAGPLNPPAGPVAATNKTLAEVEPRIAINGTNTPGDANSIFKITLPGSYYLTGNMTGAASRHGIEIASSGVTVDLMGYDLVGVPGSLDGISVSATSLVNIAVRNGSIRNWGSDGIDMASLSPSNNQIIDIRSSDNAAHGIFAGTTTTITNCVTQGNGQSGITTNSGCNVTDCVAGLNAGRGISVANGSAVTRCVASNNGLAGIVCGASGTIAQCTVDSNGAAAPGGEGIATGDGCTVIGCTVQNNTSALSGGVGDIGVGIRAGSRCVVKDCTAGRNRGHGIRVAGMCRVSGCLASENGSGSTISAGIYVSGSLSLIENNATNSCDFGIQVIGDQNMIYSNTAGENGTNYSFVADNLYGPVLDRRIPTTIATTLPVSGSSAVSTLGSTDAHANYAY